MEEERVFSRLKPKQSLLTVVKSILSLVAKPQNAKKKNKKSEKRNASLVHFSPMYCFILSIYKAVQAAD